MNERSLSGSSRIIAESTNMFVDIMADAMDFMEAGLDSQAVERFVYLHKNGYEQKAVESVLFSSIDFNQAAMADLYDKNIKLLSDYAYFEYENIPEFSALNLRFIPTTKLCYKIFDAEKRAFIPSEFDLKKQPNTTNTQPGDVPMLVNTYSSDFIENVIESTHDNNWLLGMREPVYAFYSNPSTFFSFLQLLDLEKILSSKRIVFLMGDSQLIDWLANCRYSHPTTLVNPGELGPDLTTTVRKADRDRQQRIHVSLHKINSYYQSIGKSGILQRLRGDCSRILIPTTRFSTAIQYYARDCAEALRDMGHEVSLWIEDNDLQKIGGPAILEELANFKPDLVLLIDHFRFESSIYPPELAVASWIQDPLPWIMNSDTPKKLTDMDLILNGFFSSKKIRSFGYPINREVKAPVPVNHNRFKPSLSTLENKKSRCFEIVAYSSSGDPYYGFEIFHRKFEKIIKQESNLNHCLFDFFQELYQSSIDNAPIFCTNQFTKKFSSHLKKFNLLLSEKLILVLSENFFCDVNSRIIRSVPLEWIAKRGYELKIFGEEWVNHPRLKQYAVGRAENNMLPGILSRANIVIGNNGGISTHPRVGEALLCGALYIGWNIPTGVDVAKATDYFSADNSFPVFSNEKELIGQLDFYLLNEDERRSRVMKAAKIAGSKLTYEAVMKEMMKGASQLLG
jgi:hypothetical protein